MPNAESYPFMDEFPEESSPVVPGQVVDTTDTVFAGTAMEMVYPFDGPIDFDKGLPILSRNTFGLAALATPKAPVLGQSANPIVGMDTKQLLQHEVTR